MSAVFNLASIAAAYGVVTLAFQTATGASLLGIEQQPVVPYVPLFMFAILFGLSTDYNVFLISRVREEWGRHANHRAAIAAASAGTRKIITAAGAIMIAVFMGFATDPDPVIKMTGVGLATAVLVDVTLIRLFMAPAALTLLGDKLWPRAPPPPASTRACRRPRPDVDPHPTLRPARGRVGGERLEDALPGNQGRLLFAYLVLHRDRPVRRDELLEVLWSGDVAPVGPRRRALVPALTPAQGAGGGAAVGPQ